MPSVRPVPAVFRRVLLGSHDAGVRTNWDVVATIVVIDGGNKGYIRYIGKDIKNEDVYGIELDLAVPKGTDGRHNNKRYFVCRNNHAIFVHPIGSEGPGLK